MKKPCIHATLLTLCTFVVFCASITSGDYVSESKTSNWSITLGRNDHQLQAAPLNAEPPVILAPAVSPVRVVAWAMAVTLVVVVAGTSTYFTVSTFHADKTPPPPSTPPPTPPPSPPSPPSPITTTTVCATNTNESNAYAVTVQDGTYLLDNASAAHNVGAHTYHFSGIPSGHPMMLWQDNAKYGCTVTRQTCDIPVYDSDNMTYCTGNASWSVSTGCDAQSLSLRCQIHGAMGATDRFTVVQACS